MANGDTSEWLDGAPATGWRAWFPPSRWLRTYPASWIKWDLLAGVTLAAYAVPVSLAYASLAGLPPAAGLYGYLLGGLLYALFGSSGRLAVGPTSAISLAVGITVAGLAGGDPTRWAGLASLAALVAAALFFAAWALRLDTLVNFISETILLGFKAGAALTIAMTQLPKLFGVPGGGVNFFDSLWTLFRHLGDTNPVVLCFGLTVMALLMAGERWWPGRPVALPVVILSIVASSVLPLAAHGVTTVGTLPAGLPVLSLPPLSWPDLDAVLPLAFACFLLSYVESVSAGRALAEKSGDRIDARQELLGLGAANLATAFGHGYPIAGGLSQSAVNDRAGARSPLSLVFASAVLGLCLLFLTGLLRHLPAVVLAAVVVVAVRGLVDWRAIARLRRVSRTEFRVAMAALGGVLLLGILKGILLAAVVSLLLLLAATARPHVAVLGRIPGTRRYSDRDRNPDNEPVPGAMLFRVEAPLLYFNANHVRHVIGQRIRAVPTRPGLVVIDLSNSPYVDVAGAHLLELLHRDLGRDGIDLRVAEPHARVRDLLRATGLEEEIGPIGHRTALDDVIETHRLSRILSGLETAPEAGKENE